ncbi:MAG TPA: hypothetical protein VNO86_05050 [Candidatus Binatia bacterium]|nr:hypothetical protein [Candidatus Binatia bacterium]
MLALVLAVGALLGATLYPVLLGPADETVTVVSRSTVPVRVAWEATDGWRIGEPDRDVLDPGEASTVAILERGGPEGRIRATLVPLDVAGTDTSALVLEAKPAPPPPPVPVFLVALVGAVVLGVVLAVIVGVAVDATRRRPPR